MNVLEKWLEEPARFRAVKLAFYISLAAAAATEIVVVRVLHLGHGYFPFENLPAFGSIYGFLSCMLIIVASKFIGRCGLMKDERYYD